MPLGPRARLTWIAHLFKAVTKQHHRDVLPAFRQVLTPGAVVLEAGAHAGQYTKLMARLVGDGRVYALEPSGYAYDILSKMLAVRRFAAVRPLKLAVSSAAGRAILSIPMKTNGVVKFGLSHFGGAEGGGGPVWRESVDCVALDDLVAREGLDRVDLVKADIEGWEFEMIKGADAVLARFRPVLFLEMDVGRLGRAGGDIGAFWAHLTDRGYVGFHFDTTAACFTPVPSGTAGDVWFFHREDARLPADG